MSQYFDYTPTPAEEQMAKTIDGLVDAMLNGHLAGIAVCAVTHKGKDAFFYLNKSDSPVLTRPLSKLIGLYQMSQTMKQRTTAPKMNRSYRSH